MTGDWLAGDFPAGDFSVARRDNVVTVSGEVDMATAPRLREVLAEAAGSGGLVVDLSAVTFLDSAGVAALYDHAGRGLDLVVTPESVVAVVLRVAGMAQAATIRYAATPPG